MSISPLRRMLWLVTVLTLVSAVYAGAAISAQAQSKPDVSQLKQQPEAPSAPYVLQGNAQNFSNSTTSFETSAGTWLFKTDTSDGTALTASCSAGNNCWGVSGSGKGIGVHGKAINFAGPRTVGIWGFAGETADGGTSYGGHFEASNPAAGGNTYGVYAHARSWHSTSPGSVYGVWGEAVGGGGHGVVGIGAARGVMGRSPNNGVYGFGDITGVYGYSAAGDGLSGFSNAPGKSGVVGYVNAGSGTGYGVRGYTNGTGASYGGYFSSTIGIGLYGQSNSNYGVFGRSTSGYAVVGVSNSSVGVRGVSTSNYGFYAGSTSGVGGYAYTVSGQAAFRARHNAPGAGKYSILAEGDVRIVGNLICTGNCNSAMGATTNQGERLLYAEGSTSNIATDRGTAQLKNGRAIIKIDPLFAQMVNLSAGYQVFLTPHSADTYGLAAVGLTDSSFEVVELGKGKGDFSFSWRIEAPRRGYEKERMAAAPTKVEAPLIKE